MNMKALQWMVPLFVGIPFLRCALVADALGIPVGPVRGGVEELGDGRVEIAWNMAASVPTPLSITQLFGFPPPNIMPPSETVAEAEARTKEFIDEHREIFHIASTDLGRLSGFPFLDNGWILNGNQVYRGIEVYYGFIHLWVTKEGQLVHVESRLYPSQDLSGVKTEPTLSSEEAFSIALEVQRNGLRISDPATLAIVFPSRKPVLAWQVSLGNADLPLEFPDRDRLGFWLYTIAADTGEILGAGILYSTTTDTRSFLRGDANEDGKLDISDPTFSLGALFLGGRELSCEDAADSNDDSAVDVSDAVYTLSFLFSGGPAPPAPYPYVGVDPTTDELGCGG